MQFWAPNSQVFPQDLSIMTRTSKRKCIIISLWVSSSVRTLIIGLYRWAINLVGFKWQYLSLIMSSIFILSCYCWFHALHFILSILLFTLFQLLSLRLSYRTIYWWFKFYILFFFDIVVLIIIFTIFLFFLLSIIFKLFLKSLIYFSFIHFLENI